MPEIDLLETSDDSAVQSGTVARRLPPEEALGTLACRRADAPKDAAAARSDDAGSFSERARREPSARERALSLKLPQLDSNQQPGG